MFVYTFERKYKAVNPVAQRQRDHWLSDYGHFSPTSVATNIQYKTTYVVIIFNIV